MYESETSKGLSPDQKTLVYAPGCKVRVTQQIPQTNDVYSTTVEGVVLRQERQGSGSWYAHNKRGKVWLDRLVIKKTDGEISILNLDEYSRVEVLEGEQPKAGVSKLVLPNEDPAASIT